MTNLDSIFKSRDITLPTKIRLVKAMVLPVVMYGSIPGWGRSPGEGNGNLLQYSCPGLGDQPGEGGYKKKIWFSYKGIVAGKERFSGTHQKQCLTGTEKTA